MRHEGSAFADQQVKAHSWAEETYLDPLRAEESALMLAHRFGFKKPRFIWEVPALLPTAWAGTIRNDRTGELTIAFRGLGCTLFVLCHELVHCWRDWDDEYHDDVDWDLCIILLEEARHGVV